MQKRNKRSPENDRAGLRGSEINAFERDTASRLVVVFQNRYSCGVDPWGILDDLVFAGYAFIRSQPIHA